MCNEIDKLFSQSCGRQEAVASFFASRSNERKFSIKVVEMGVAGAATCKRWEKAR